MYKFRPIRLFEIGSNEPAKFLMSKSLWEDIRDWSEEELKERQKIMETITGRVQNFSSDIISSERRAYIMGTTKESNNPFYDIFQNAAEYDNIVQLKIGSWAWALNKLSQGKRVSCDRFVSEDNGFFLEMDYNGDLNLMDLDKLSDIEAIGSVFPDFIPNQHIWYVVDVKLNKVD